MKLVGMIPVRNEAWILGLSARVALQWCDEIVIYLHASQDQSWEIARDLTIETKRVTVHIDVKPEWDEMNHRQSMLWDARELNATHIAIIDADEILTANLLPNIRAMVEGTPRGHILQLPLYNLRGGVNVYHANGLWGNRIVSVAFADDPVLHWGGDRFHHREPMGRRLTGYVPVQQGEGGVLHFWGSSERRLKAKHALYACTEALRWPEKPIREIASTYSMWRDGIKPHERPQDWKFQAVPTSWTEGYDMTRLHVDEVPWQIGQVQELLKLYGPDRFAGLDLFGVENEQLEKGQ